MEGLISALLFLGAILILDGMSRFFCLRLRKDIRRYFAATAILLVGVLSFFFLLELETFPFALLLLFVALIFFGVMIFIKKKSFLPYVVMMAALFLTLFILFVLEENSESTLFMVIPLMLSVFCSGVGVLDKWRQMPYLGAAVLTITIGVITETFHFDVISLCLALATGGVVGAAVCLRPLPEDL